MYKYNGILLEGLRRVIFKEPQYGQGHMIICLPQIACGAKM